MPRPVRARRHRRRVSGAGVVREGDPRRHPRDRRAAPDRRQDRAPVAHRQPAPPRRPHRVPAARKGHAGAMIPRAAVLGLAGLAIAGVARAAPAAPQDTAPDRAAIDAADANLEPTIRRRGTTFTLALGGGLMAGFGIAGSVGRAGSVSLRLGQVATPRLVLTLETAITAVLH